MNQQNDKDSPTNLLRELETLQRVLDGAAGEQVELDKLIPVLDPLEDIPVLDELFANDDIPVLKAVPRPAPAAPKPAPDNAPVPPVITERHSPASISRVLQQVQQAQSRTETNPAPARISGNPFLPQSVLDRLTQEREAAQHSAEEAHRTMQKVMEQKQQRASTALTGMGKTLTAEQKDALINQLVDEMLPQIAERLRDKLRIMLSR